MKFQKDRRTPEFVSLLRIGVRKNQNILRPSTRRDLSISAKKSRFPDGFKKTGVKVANFGIFSLGDVEHPTKALSADPSLTSIAEVRLKNDR